MSYAEQRAWAEQYMPAVCAIVGPRLLVSSPIQRDQKENTDLIVLRARDMDIAVRMRKPGFVEQYGDQITIRSVNGGYQTELQKLAAGWGDWMFYGHAGPNFTVQKWYLIDLHKLRLAFICRPALIHQPDDVISGWMPNKDGRTEFRWFRPERIKPNVIIDSGNNDNIRQLRVVA